LLEEKGRVGGKQFLVALAEAVKKGSKKVPHIQSGKAVGGVKGDDSDDKGR